MLRYNALKDIQDQLERKYEDSAIIRFGAVLGETERLIEDLQHLVMDARMLPVQRVFNRFPRIVRDIARKRNKKVQIEITGESTTLDKTVIENIEDPLVHMIRNCIDHGIEPEDERVKKGKPPIGKITLAAYAEGENVVIEVGDDGRGIDLEKVKKKAIEKGLISEKEAESLDDRSIIEFIFEPGFSTAKEIDDMSGRGVGMDVVKANVEQLGGSVEVETEKDKGTKFRLIFPKTLAIVKSLIVKVGTEYYAIPISSIYKTVKAFDDDITTMEGKEVLRYLDKIIPIVKLDELLELNFGDRQKDTSFGRYMVIVQEGEKLAALEVDELIGQEQIVKKPLSKYARAATYVTGATIRGDGRVALILDVPELVKVASRMLRKKPWAKLLA